MSTACPDPALGNDRPLRIAYVLKRYPRFSETFVVNEVLAHEAAGADISIFALRPPTDTHFRPAIARVQAPVTYLQYANVRANDFWKLLDRQLGQSVDRVGRILGTADCDGIDMYQALQLAQALQNQRVDHIHAHFATSAATVARLASLITGIPYTFTAHAKDIFHEYVNSRSLAQKLEDAAAVVTVSHYNLRYLCNEFPRSASKVCCIYNGLPLDEFGFVEQQDSRPLIVGIGRLVEKKGFADLIAACSLLSHEGIDYRCEIIGGGELAGALQRQITEQSLESRVSLLGPLPSDKVVATLRKAAVLAAPCVTAATGDRDGMPTVLLEAMAVGVPCVASAVAGIPEVVRHQHTGWLVPERSPEQLAAAIRRMLGDRPLGRQLARAAREQMERDFDVRQNAARQRGLFTRHGRSTGLASLSEAV